MTYTGENFNLEVAVSKHGQTEWSLCLELRVMENVNMLLNLVCGPNVLCCSKCEGTCRGKPDFRYQPEVCTDSKFNFNAVSHN